MAGFIITTDMAPEKALRLACDVADGLDFEVSDVNSWTFRATKGSFPLSIFLGAFIAYCCFDVEIQDGSHHDEVDIVIIRNSPWWTGWIGVQRVKSRAKELAEAIADAVEKEGARVVRERAT